MEPLELARPIIQAAKFYNDAMLSIETNNIGFTTQARVMESYHNLYRWQYFDAVGGAQYSRKYGWSTTATTKPVMITYARHILNEDAQGHFTVELNDRQLVDELSTFQENMGSFGAAKGHNDDLAMAWMIAITSLHRERNGRLDLGVTEMKDEQTFDGRASRGRLRFRGPGGAEIFMPEKEDENGYDQADHKEEYAWLKD